MVVGRDNSRVAQGWGRSGGSHGKVGFELTWRWECVKKAEGLPGSGRGQAMEPCVEAVRDTADGARSKETVDQLDGLGCDARSLPSINWLRSWEQVLCKNWWLGIGDL